MTGLTHRLRGHRLRRRRIWVDTSRGGVESGRIDDMLVCSCGERWRHVVEPLTNRWYWQ